MALHIWGDFGIRYYGLAYLLAFGLGYYFLTYLRRKGKSPLTADQESTALTALLLGVIAGGRLGYIILYDFSQALHNPLIIFKVWEGGMSSHGGFAGVILACWWITRRFRIPFFRFSDLLCVLTPPGLFLVRVANFINGELWGKITTVPWAVIFPQSMPPNTLPTHIPPRHPSQLYEAVLEGAFLLLFTQWRVGRTSVLSSPGRLSGEFLILYALARILAEQFRESDASLLLGMSRGVFYTFFLVFLGGVFLLRSYSKRKC